MNGLEVLDMLSGADLGQQGFDLADLIFGTQQACGLAHNLLTRVAEKPFSGRVPVRDDAVQFAGDDGIRVELHHRRHAVCMAPALL